ncbi:hypothetical protein NXF25_004458, partial [Crotalus adamanteus]
MLLHPGCYGEGHRFLKVGMQRRKGAMQRLQREVQIVQPATKMASCHLWGPKPHANQGERNSRILYGETAKNILTGAALLQNKQGLDVGLQENQKTQQQKGLPMVPSLYSVWRPSRLFESVSEEDMMAFKASYRMVKPPNQLSKEGRMMGRPILQGLSREPQKAPDNLTKLAPLKEQTLTEVPGLLEEELVNSPTSEHNPSDSVESCISIDEEEEEAILEPKEPAQDSQKQNTLLLGISEPMEWGIPLEKITGKLISNPELEEIHGSRPMHYPGESMKQDRRLSENKRRCQEAPVSQKKKKKTTTAKAVAENGLCPSLGFLKNRKVQTEKMQRCNPCEERLSKKSSSGTQEKVGAGEQPAAKGWARGSDLPKRNAILKRDEEGPENREVVCK